MSSKLNTTQASKQHNHNCIAAQQESTYHHIKKLEAEEYLTLLTNKHKHNAHCENCTNHTIQKYTHKCKILNKIIQPYNICARWRIVSPV
jgi:hypothetical protein